MKLGSDVSGLSTAAANAAAQGLSIVVPVYNEAREAAAEAARPVRAAVALAKRGAQASWPTCSR